MKNQFDIWLLYGYVSTDLVWFRIRWFNCGLYFNVNASFSQRNNLKKYVKIGKWYISILKPYNPI